MQRPTALPRSPHACPPTAPRLNPTPAVWVRHCLTHTSACFLPRAHPCAPGVLLLVVHVLPVHPRAAALDRPGGAHAIHPELPGAAARSCGCGCVSGGARAVGVVPPRPARPPCVPVPRTRGADCARGVGCPGLLGHTRAPRLSGALTPHAKASTARVGPPPPHHTMPSGPWPPLHGLAHPALPASQPKPTAGRPTWPHASSPLARRMRRTAASATGRTTWPTSTTPFLGLRGFRSWGTRACARSTPRGRCRRVRGVGCVRWGGVGVGAATGAEGGTLGVGGPVGRAADCSHHCRLFSDDRYYSTHLFSVSHRPTQFAL